MQERRAALGEALGAVGDRRVDVQPPAARLLEPRADQELGVDRHGLAVADEDPRRHRRERVPGRQQADRLVERAGDEPAVRDPGTALVALVEREVRLVLGQALRGRQRQAQAGRVVAAPPARGVMVRRDRACQTFSNVPKRSSWT